MFCRSLVAFYFFFCSTIFREASAEECEWREMRAARREIKKELIMILKEAKSWGANEMRKGGVG